MRMGIWLEGELPACEAHADIGRICVPERHSDFRWRFWMFNRTSK